MNARLLRLGVSCLGLLLSASGAGAQQEREELRTPIAGIVAKIHVKDGDVIKKGELLIELDSTNAKRELAEAQSSVAAARAAVDLTNARSQRAIQLLKVAAISRAEFEAITAESAQSQIKLTAQFANESAKRVALEQTRIQAQKDGIVTTLQVKAGEAVKAGAIVATITARESGTQSPEKIRELMKERHTILGKIADLAFARYIQGRGAWAPALQTRRDLLEASFELAQTSAERIEILRKNVQMAEELKKIMDARFAAGTAEEETLQVHALLLEVRIRLAREESKAKLDK